MRSGAELKEVNLSDCGLTEVPNEVFLPNVAKNVELLNLGGNNISSLPNEMTSLVNLRILFFAGNAFTSIPKVLGQLPSLYMLSFKENRITHIPDEALSPSICWLILTGNQIKELPASIGKCTGMRKLMLSLNQLSSLPEEMKNLHNLELIRLAGNKFESLPDWLLTLPQLSWIAYAGNSMEHPETSTCPSAMQEVPWEDISLQQKIGEGASGEIHIAHCKGFDAPLAIKLFRSEGNSDGFPADEMKASVAADVHPNCLQVLGKVLGGPRPALLLPLIPDEFKPLGKPPSFTTITRDTFPAGTLFSLASLLNILRGILSIVMHLHARGIMHGDLYAHNILVNGTGNSLLVDFGAATFFPPSTAIARQLESVEVRAFGCLMDDLLSHLDHDDAATPASETVLTRLQTLRNRCISADLLSRPSFSDIHESIHTDSR